MFTGIITDVGAIRQVEKRGDTHIVIATHYDVGAIDIGASIACSGVCLTVVDKGNSTEFPKHVLMMDSSRPCAANSFSFFVPHLIHHQAL